MKQPSIDALADVRRKIVTFLRANDDFVVAAHENADGDAIGSVLAFGRLLDKIGKQYRIVLHDRVPDLKYQFLPDFETIGSIETAGDLTATNAILLDTPTVGRMGRMAEVIGPDTAVINIDHHESNEYFGTLNLVDPGASATTQMLCDVAAELKIEPDPEMATQIYLGIMFDTGRFRFSNTSSKVLRTSAKMVECGARPAAIADAIYSQRPPDAMYALAGALSRLELHAEGRIASMYLENGLITEDTDVEGISDYGISIAGVEASVFIREYEKGQLRVNLRSRGLVNVSNVARIFNGGGHPNAAGCRVQGDLHETRRALVAEIGKHLSTSSE